MSSSFAYRYWLIIAAMFVCTQTYAITHTAAYGDEAHHHEGVDCPVSSTPIVVADLNGLSVYEFVNSLEDIRHKSSLTHFAAWSCLPGWPPPPRGPPIFS
ncbi:hypothetical protein [Hirschia litorea]|uniref:Uncharacterized protein n=1 Tax=Hirschia litorea TaxID=1199156 RepID=A0ABW2IHN2_9PROT